MWEVWTSQVEEKWRYFLKTLIETKFLICDVFIVDLDLGFKTGWEQYWELGFKFIDVLNGYNLDRWYKHEQNGLF